MSRIVIEKTSGKDDRSELFLDFELDTTRSYTIGRHPSNDVQIDHASISRMHALIFHHGDRWMIADLDSTKGLFHMGERLRCGALADEMCVTMGPARLWFAEGPEHASERPSSITHHIDVLQMKILSNQGKILSNQAFCLAGFRNVSIGSDVDCDIRPKNSEVNHCMRSCSDATISGFSPPGTRPVSNPKTRRSEPLWNLATTALVHADTLFSR